MIIEVKTAVISAHVLTVDNTNAGAFFVLDTNSADEVLYLLDYVSADDDGVDLAVDLVGPGAAGELFRIPADERAEPIVIATRAFDTTGRAVYRYPAGGTQRVGVSAGVPGASPGVVTIDIVLIASKG